MTKPTILDLFCGCGGFGLGAELAGFNCCAAIDIDAKLQSAYRLNFPTTNVIEADISALSRSNWKTILQNSRPDGIIGGPPCQGFSRIGKKASDDPRNNLVHHFFRHISLLRPKFFVMENVEGILDRGSIEHLHNALDQISNNYKVLAPLIVNAADFGAPTKRSRVVIIGFDPSRMSTLDTKHFSPKKDQQLSFVKDAISDLPPPYAATRKKDDFAWARYPERTTPISQYAKQARKLPPKNLGWKKSIDQLKRGLVSGLDITKHNATVSSRYLALVNGKIDPVSKSSKLSWSGFCPTLRAGTGPDKGSFQAVRPIHPEEGRVITVREAARLQGFPDWFTFHHTKWTSFRMIGNSVSPIVSEKILHSILNQLSF